MHFSTILLLFVACAYSTLIPQTFNANFDDREGNPVLARLTPVGFYKNLNYIRFGIRPDEVTVLRAHSPNNSAVFASIGNLAFGNPGPATTTTDYPGSKVSYFDLNSTYIGCGVQTLTTVGLPQKCDVLVTGTKANGDQVPHTCPYRGTIADPDFVLCNFPSSFRSLKNVTFNPKGTDLPTPPALLIDDCRYTTYSSK